MARSPKPVFLERQSYRVRRLGDAAKLLPILGLVLILVPVLWADEARTRGGIVYLFSVWAVLILVVAFLSRRLAEAGSDADAGTQEASGDPPADA